MKYEKNNFLLAGAERRSSYLKTEFFMRKLNEIAADLRDLLGTKFQTVRISAMQNSGQLIQEIKAVNPENFPA